MVEAVRHRASQALIAGCRKKLSQLRVDLKEPPEQNCAELLHFGGQKVPGGYDSQPMALGPLAFHGMHAATGLVPPHVPLDGGGCLIRPAGGEL